MDNVDEIKRKINIVDLVSSYLTLKKAGKNYKACCPFHNEKTPSFMVSPEKQIWYCFGCNKGGDIFSFVEQIEGLDFVGALNLLADKVGIVLEKGNFTKKSEKDRFFQITELSARFFHFILTEHKGGEIAKRYITEKRKIKDKTIRDFMIGYAPDNPTILMDYLIKKGFSKSDLEKLGIITKSYKGNFVDKFRDRIIFPIKNTNGKIVGFGGRIFREVKGMTLPKYINSVQSDIYDKSSVLYGLDQAKEAIRQKDLVIIVEGYLDVITSHQAGVKNVVASSGTALTQRQVEILSRYTSNIAFCFDSDEAGQMATKRAMEITQFSDINVKAIKIEGAKDPDELILKDPSLWESFSSNPMPIIDYYYDSLMKKNNLAETTEDKKKISQEFIPVLSHLYNDIEKAHWIKKISYDLAINEKYFIEALNKVEKSKNQVFNKKDSEEKTEDNFSKIKISKEMLLLAMVVLYPFKIKELIEKTNIEDIADVLGKNVYNIILEWHNGNKEKEINVEYIKNKIEKESHAKIDLLFFLALNFFDGISEKDILIDIDSLMQDLIKKRKDKRRREIEFELVSIDKTKDKEKIKILLRELQNLI